MKRSLISRELKSFYPYHGMLFYLIQRILALPLTLPFALPMPLPMPLPLLLPLLLKGWAMRVMSKRYLIEHRQGKWWGHTEQPIPNTASGSVSQEDIITAFLILLAEAIPRKENEILGFLCWIFKCLDHWIKEKKGSHEDSPL